MQKERPEHLQLIDVTPSSKSMGRGLSNRGVLLLVAGLCLVASAGALGSLYKNSELYAIFSMLAVVSVLVPYMSPLPVQAR